MGGRIYARHRSMHRWPAIMLAAIEPFNLNSFDSANVLHISPPQNLVSVRSQEEELFYQGSGHFSFSINRFDFVLDSASLMRLFMESRSE